LTSATGRADDWPHPSIPNGYSFAAESAHVHFAPVADIGFGALPGSSPFASGKLLLAAVILPWQQLFGHRGMTGVKHQPWRTERFLSEILKAFR
jgi:hypothetical protein